MGMHYIPTQALKHVFITSYDFTLHFSTEND